jgi:hypothetical protein
MNYNNTKIYKIWSTRGPKIYIGSTTKDRLCDRMAIHRNDYKRWKLGKTNKITSFDLFEKYGLENCFIELIEEKSCNNKEEKNKLEGGYIRTLDCVNKIIPDRNQKEYREDNKEYKKDYFKKYNELNKDKIKEYYETNKDKIKEIRKQYRKDNKNKINENKSIPYNCICGSICRIGDKSKHFKTKKHINFTNNQ